MLPALAFGLAAAQESPPRGDARESWITETQDVRRVQIDVSVIDPRGDELSSVPGLPREAFELRLDYRPLPPEISARVEFDEICPPASGTPVHRDAPDSDTAAGPLADDRPTLLVVVDLNFLDTRMRHKSAQAIEELATLARTRTMRVKVLAFNRRLVTLTSDFTSDPAEIARAGRALLDIGSFAPPLTSRRIDVPTLPPHDLQNPVRPDTPEAPGEPTDPNRVRSAFTIIPSGMEVVDELGRPLYGETLAQRLAERDADPRPSLAALEAVLLSHAGIRGRKALVLFTSSWFDLPDEMWLRELRGPRRAAQGGFTIWGVDARGLAGGPGTHRSRMLTFLSASTGGEFLRSAGRLAHVFDRAIAQLSCYYLFSIPLSQPRDGEREIPVDVRLDTRTHPEYWYYRVRAASDVTLLGRQREREKRRLAALMEPDAHRFPEVRLTASYPAGDPASSVIEVGTVLSDLTFSASGPNRASAGSALSARFALEGTVLDAAGRTICRLGDGTERTVSVEQQPARFPPSLLVLRSRCPISQPGRYDIRAVVEDLVTGDIGAGVTTIDVAAVDHGLTRLSALRVGRSSGRDFLIDVGTGPAAQGIARDARRQTFAPLLPDEPVVVDDRVRLRFVACGGWSPAVILRRPGADPVPLETAALGERRSDGAACREFEASVAEGSLGEGTHTIEVLDAGAPRRDVLGSVEIRVVSREAPPAPAPGTKT